MEDHTGEIWATTFDEAATSLLQMSVKELYMLQYEFLL